MNQGAARDGLAPRVREALAGWRRAQATEELTRWRGDAVALDHAALARAHGWLASASALEMLRAAQADGELDALAAESLAAHLGEARRHARFATLWDVWAELQQTPLVIEAQRVEVPQVLGELLAGQGPRTVSLAQGLSRALSMLLVHAHDAWCAAQVAEAEPAILAKERQDAARFLEQTQDAAEDVVAWALRGAGRAQPRVWHGLWRALQPRQPTATRQRLWLEVAEHFVPLGLRRVLENQVRVEASVMRWPRHAVLVVDPPQDVRIGIAKTTGGPPGLRAAVEASGDALHRALVSPALPIEQRWAVEVSAPAAAGMLWGQRLADPAYWRRAGTSAAAADERSRCEAAGLLMGLRVQCGLVLAAPTKAEADVGVWRARAIEVLQQAAGVDVDQGLIAMAGVAYTPGTVLGRLSGLALHLASREIYDEDWYRNPRMGEVLRGAAARGGSLSADAWCEELGTSPRQAGRRIAELWKG